MKERLIDAIMNYWFDCIMLNGKADRLINNLLEDYVRESGRTYDGTDIYRTVENLSKSQQRKLLKIMQESNIIGRCGGIP